MVKKIMGVGAAAALVLTLGIKVVEARNAQMVIWQYQDGSNDTTTGTPDCSGPTGTCALLYEYDPNTADHIGAPVLNPDSGEQEFAVGVRN